jgi:DNA modification methylase
VRLLLPDPPYGINYQGRPYFFQDGEIPGDESPEQAAGLLGEMLELLKPKLAEQAHLLVFASARHDPLTRAVLSAAGFTIRSFLIWVKDGHGVGDCKRSFGPEHGCIVHASTGGAEMRLRQGSVFHYPRVRPHLHPTQKPVGLLAELIQATTSPGELVCDPFAGVASTLVAAIATGRNAWGTELNPDWHQAGVDRFPHAGAELAQANTGPGNKAEAA